MGKRKTKGQSCSVVIAGMKWQEKHLGPLRCGGGGPLVQGTVRRLPNLEGNREGDEAGCGYGGEKFGFNLMFTKMFFVSLSHKIQS